MGPCAREALNDYTGRGDISPSVGAPVCGTEENLTPELTTHWLNAAPDQQWAEPCWGFPLSCSRGTTSHPTLATPLAVGVALPESKRNQGSLYV